MTRRRYVQDPQTGRLVPREEYRRPGPRVHDILPDIEAFVSPVDGRVISSRPRLREHNAEHGVAQHGDYGDNNGAEYFRRAEQSRQLRLQAQDAASRRERLETVVAAVHKHSRRD